MRRAVLSFSSFVFGCLVVGASGCSSSSMPIGQGVADANTSSEPADSGSEMDAQPIADAGSTDAQPGSSSWYLTCGDPVCRAPESDAGLTDPDGGACPALGSRS